MKVMIVQQVAIIASPALMMGLMLTTSVGNTFRIHWPSWKFLGAACLLPVALHPLSVELLGRLQWFFGELPEGIVQALRQMSDPDQPLWFVLLTFAVVPAFCEEIAFRGFMLSGFGRRGRIALAVGLSSVVFGVMHMIPQQVFNAGLMGLVLGMLCVRSNSLVPCIVFHFITNSLGVVHGRFATDWYNAAPVPMFFAVEDGGLRYRWPTLVICLAIAAPLLVWLFRSPKARRHEAVPSGGNGNGLLETISAATAKDALVAHRK